MNKMCMYLFFCVYFDNSSIYLLLTFIISTINLQNVKVYNNKQGKPSKKTC